MDGFSIEGGSQSFETSLRVVTPRFFDTMGISLRAGRDFSPDDRAGSAKVVIINETIARRYFDGQSPIGKRIQVSGPDLREIVDVIADTKYRHLREATPNTVYLPMAQAEPGSASRVKPRQSNRPAAPSSDPRSRRGGQVAGRQPRRR